MIYTERKTIVGFKYILAIPTAVVVTWTFHEFAHWVTGELLGDEMIMTLNSCYPKSGRYNENWHSTVISSAGPIITLLQAILFYGLIKRNGNKLLFPLLLACLYMRFLAGVMNFLNPNDEGRIGIDLGLGTFTFSILMTGILFYLTYDISKKEGFSIKLIVGTVLLIMLFSSIIILSDQLLKIKVL